MTGQRLRDAALAGTGLVLLSPAIAAVALAVLVCDGRPLLFRQVRSGLNGRRFVLAKFRTMTTGRDRRGALLPDAARTTRLGALLRRTRLDELPQLWNVLRGDMSLVGPRPLLPETIANAGAVGARRGAVRPGLTGWAQVAGNTLLTDGDKLALDRWYVDHRSARLDFAILFRTARVIVRGERLDPHAIRSAHASGTGRRG